MCDLTALEGQRAYETIFDLHNTIAWVVVSVVTADGKSRAVLKAAGGGGPEQMAEHMPEDGECDAAVPLPWGPSGKGAVTSRSLVTRAAVPFRRTDETSPLVLTSAPPHPHAEITYGLYRVKGVIGGDAPSERVKVGGWRSPPPPLSAHSSSFARSR
jgi:hypothetical protein